MGVSCSTCECAPFIVAYNHLMHKRASVTVGVNLTGACGVLFPFASVYSIALAEPAIALESIMACRVFRRVVLSSIRSNDGTHSLHAPYESGVMMTTILPYAPYDATPPIALNENIS